MTKNIYFVKENISFKEWWFSNMECTHTVLNVFIQATWQPWSIKWTDLTYSLQASQSSRIPGSSPVSVEGAILIHSGGQHHILHVALLIRHSLKKSITWTAWQFSALSVFTTLAVFFPKNIRKSLVLNFVASKVSFWPVTMQSVNRWHELSWIISLFSDLACPELSTFGAKALIMPNRWPNPVSSLTGDITIQALKWITVVNLHHTRHQIFAYDKWLARKGAQPTRILEIFELCIFVISFTSELQWRQHHRAVIPKQSHEILLHQNHHLVKMSHTGLFRSKDNFTQWWSDRPMSMTQTEAAGSSDLVMTISRVLPMFWIDCPTCCDNENDTNSSWSHLLSGSSRWILMLPVMMICADKVAKYGPLDSQLSQDIQLVFCYHHSAVQVKRGLTLSLLKKCVYTPHVHWTTFLNPLTAVSRRSG